MKGNKKPILFGIMVLVLILGVFGLSACAEEGKSAYEIAVEYGYSGSVVEWLESLKSDVKGDSAYDIAVKNGFEGTESEWLQSLKGAKGEDGILDVDDSVYQIAVEQGFEGTVEQWLESLDGESAYELACSMGYEGTLEQWLNGLKGEKGEKGQDGLLDIGNSVYEIAVEQGFEGTIEQWLESLKGPEGAKGEAGENAISAAANNAILSSVSIKCDFVQPTYDLWGRLRGTEEVSYSGSGVIFRDDKQKGDAYIITNYHVVHNINAEQTISTDISVYLYGREYIPTLMKEDTMAIPATFVGGSYTYDIAVLKITNSSDYKQSESRAIEYVNSDSCFAGDDVIAIGNPNGAGISVTSGILSVDSEYITMTTDYEEGEQINRVNVSYRVMRIDAAVNGGNSGGGLFNSDGKLIGIVNAKDISTNIDNISYAIPSNIAVNVADNIIRNCDGNDTTKVKKCQIGVVLGVSDSSAHYDEQLAKTKVVQKVIVTEVSEGSIASGKIEVNDLIKSFEYKGETVLVDRYYTIIDFMLKANEGDKLTINIERDGQPHSVELTLVAPVAIG